MRRLLIVFALLAALVPAAWPVASQTQPADLILVNGTVLTVDARDTIAEALAVRGGKIVAVGATADISRMAGERTTVVDLAGRTATPGLIDTHLHVSPPSDQLDLSDPDIRTIADLQARLRAAVAAGAGGTRASSPKRASSARPTSTSSRPTTPCG